MVLAFTPRPIRHPFAQPSPSVPAPAPWAKSLPNHHPRPPHPAPWITRPSAELQPTCWIQGQLGFRCHNKNHSLPLMIVWLLGRPLYHPFFLSLWLSFFKIRFSLSHLLLISLLLSRPSPYLSFLWCFRLLREVTCAPASLGRSWGTCRV